MSDLFGTGSNMSRRFIKDYDDLSKVVANVIRGAGKKIAFVAGTFDVKHHGHERYLEKGKQKSAEILGADIRDIILIVGVDSDESVKERKGPGRPTIPLDQRAEQLCHSRHVDVVTITREQGPQWKAMETIKPDALIISKRVKATEEQKKKFKKYCGYIIELESQATTSTSAIVRKILVHNLNEIEEKAGELIESIENLKKGG